MFLTPPLRPAPTIEIMTSFPDRRDPIDVAAVIERSGFGRLQATVLTLCLLSMVTDGFDVQALAYTAPSIVREWGVKSSVLGPVLAAANVGVLVGSLGLSVVADRIGRRPVLIGATVMFAVVTLLTARATSIGELEVLRFLAGIGLGTIAPNVSALVGEYCSSRLRPTMIMVVGVGLTAGAAVGGFIAAALIPAYGWRSVFYFGGAVPLVIVIAMIAWLPESLPLMALWRRDKARLAGWLNRIDPTVGATAHSLFVVPERPERRPVRGLFEEGRGPATVLFWAVNFMNLLALYSLSLWLPTVARDAGFDSATSVLIGTTFQVGGTIGTFGLAWLVARFGFVRMLGVSFVIAAISTGLIGQPGLSLPVLFLVVFVAGWCVVGSQPGLNALSGAYYPTPVRSTGVGAGLGVGRIGAIVGPVIGGQLVGAHWITRDLFLAAALPPLLAAIVMVGLARVLGTRMGRSR